MQYLVKGAAVFQQQPMDIYKAQTDTVKPVRPACSCMQRVLSLCFRLNISRQLPGQANLVHPVLCVSNCLQHAGFLRRNSCWTM